MNNGFECYKVYVGIKSHFSEKSYDYLKYKGRINVTMDSFLKRNDKRLFETISKMVSSDLYVPFFISQFIYTSDVALDKIINSPSYTQKTFNKFKSNLSNLLGNLQADMRKLSIDSNYNWKTILSIEKPSLYPLIFNEVFTHRIQPESYSIISNLFNKEYPELERDMIYQTLDIKYRKYRSFLKISNEEIFKIVKKDLTSYKE